MTKTKNLLVGLVLASAAMLTMHTASAAMPSIYAGVNVGHSAMNVDAVKSGGDSVGVLVGRNYTSRYGAEVGYTRFAAVRDMGMTARLEAVTAQGVARMDVPQLAHTSVFVKAGLGYTHAYGAAVSEHRFAPVAAVGVDYALSDKVSLRAEHQVAHHFAHSGAEVRNTVAGLTYRF